MNKKGGIPRVVLWPAYVLFASLIGYVIYSVIDNATTNEGFARKYFLNDLGLTMDAISSANHDLSITYTMQNDYDITLTNGNIKIENEVLTYKYVQDNNLDLINEISLKKDSRLLITKSGNVISMNVQKPTEVVIT